MFQTWHKCQLEHHILLSVPEGAPSTIAPKYDAVLSVDVKSMVQCVSRSRKEEVEHWWSNEQETLTAEGTCTCNFLII